MQRIRSVTAIVIVGLSTTQMAAKPIVVKTPSGEDVTLYGVDSIEEGECAGVAQGEVDRLLVAGGVVVKPESPVLGGGAYVTVRGRLLNSIALSTGCAKLTATRGTFINDMRMAQQSAVFAQKGVHRPRTMTAEERAALDELVTEAPPPPGLAWTGNGSKDTESFSVGSREWVVNWSANPTSVVGGVVSVGVHRVSDGQRVSSLSSGLIRQASSDRSFVRSEPGRYYLSINSANVQWRVWVEER